MPCYVRCVPLLFYCDIIDELSVFISIPGMDWFQWGMRSQFPFPTYITVTGGKMKIEELITEVQKVLGVDADGKAGPETWSAIYKNIVTPTLPDAPPVPDIAPVDQRSEKVIATLLPQVQPLARALVQKAALSGICIKIICGFRTYAEQDALYAQGRTVPGNKVTNAKGGFSNHNFGIAFDIGVFEGNKYLGDSPKYNGSSSNKRTRNPYNALFQFCLRFGASFFLVTTSTFLASMIEGRVIPAAASNSAANPFDWGIF